ncbi:MAG: AraC family transcriptional regulator [Oscillospiraceae bacterium]
MLRGLKFHFDNEYISEPVRYGPVLLWQIGDIGCDPGYVVKDHEQYCYEITCVVGGKGMISSNGREYPIEKGQLYLNRRHEIHCIKSDVSDPIRYFYIGFDFDEDLLDKTWEDVFEAFESCETPLARDKYGVQSVFSNAFNEMMAKDAISHEMIGYYVFQILLLCYRSIKLSNPKQYMGADAHEQSQQLIYSIINYIDTNVCAVEQLEDIGKQVGYSYAHISRLFKQVVGKSLRDYYIEKRFDKAVAFLKAGMNSTEIAHLLKYQSLNSFSKAFNKYFGMPPSEYKNKILNKDKNN